MTKKLARRLMSRRLNRLLALSNIGIRALSRSEGKLIRKCTSVLVKED